MIMRARCYQPRLWKLLECIHVWAEVERWPGGADLGGFCDVLYRCQLCHEMKMHTEFT